MFTSTISHGALVSALLFAASCSRSQPQRHVDGYETLALRYEGNPGVVSVPELAEDLGYLAPIKLDYVGSNTTGGPHSIQAVVTGDIDFGSSFNGAIVKLVAAKAKLKAIVASYGTDVRNFQGTYVLADSPIRSARDLIGKKVAMNTLGAHAEFALREFLQRNGVSSAEAQQVAMIALPSANCELALRERQVDAAILGTIHRDKALARGGLRQLTSDFELFGDLNAGSVVMTTKFLEANPNSARKLVSAVGRAIEWTKSHTREEVIARMVRIVEKRKRNEDTSIVKHWRGTGVAAKYGALSDRDFQIWVDWLVRDGQVAPGKFSARSVYTNEFQPTVVVSAGAATSASAGLRQ